MSRIGGPGKTYLLYYNVYIHKAFYVTTSFLLGINSCIISSRYQLTLRQIIINMESCEEDADEIRNMEKIIHDNEGWDVKLVIVSADKLSFLSEDDNILYLLRPQIFKYCGFISKFWTFRTFEAHVQESNVIEPEIVKCWHHEVDEKDPHNSAILKKTILTESMYVRLRKIENNHGIELNAQDVKLLLQDHQSLRKVPSQMDSLPFPRKSILKSSEIKRPQMVDSNDPSDTSKRLSRARIFAEAIEYSIKKDQLATYDSDEFQVVGEDLGGYLHDFQQNFSEASEQLRAFVCPVPDHEYYRNDGLMLFPKPKDGSLMTESIWWERFYYNDRRLADEFERDVEKLHFNDDKRDQSDGLSKLKRKRKRKQLEQHSRPTRKIRIASQS